MNYKIILWVLMILLTVYSASAAISNNPNTYVLYDDFDRADNTSFGDTVTGETWDKGADVHANAGINNSMALMLGTRAAVDNTDFISVIYGATTATRGVWYKNIRIDTLSTMYLRYLSGANNRCEMRWVNGDFKYLSAGGATIDTNQNYAINTKYNITILFNSTADNCLYRINGSGINYDSGFVNDHESLTATQVSVAMNDNGVTHSIFESVRVFNGTQLPVVPPPPPPPAVNVTANYSTPVYEEKLTIHSLLIKTANITNLTTANLSYDGFIYAGVINWTNASYVRFITNLTTPRIYANNTPMYFNWSYILQFTNGSNQSNTAVNYNQNIVWNLTKYPRINITAFAINGTPINIFELTSVERTINTTTGEIYFWTNATKTLNISIDNPSYAITWALINFTSGNLGSHNFSLYATNSIFFTFRDEETRTIINNATLELVSDDYSNNYSTTNGTLYIYLLSPVLYSIKYESIGCPARFYFFNLQNRTFTNLTLYLVQNTSATSVSATVYDESNFEVENAYIKVLRYDLSTNSYLIQEIAKTNFEGRAQLNLVLNSEYYKFLIEYPLGTIAKITSPTYIYSTAVTFQITTGIDVAQKFYVSQDISHSLYFNNATNNFKFIYSDANNILSKGCLYLYKTTLAGDTLINYTCVNSSAATILLHAANISGTMYRADAFIYFSDEYFLQSAYHTFSSPGTTGKYGVFLIMILTIIFAFIGFWDKSVALIITPLPILIGSVIKFIDIPIGIALCIEIVCFIIAIWVSKYGKS